MQRVVGAGNAPRGRLVRCHEAECIFVSLSGVLCDLLEQVILHRGTLTFPELEYVLELVTAERLVDLEFRGDQNLCLCQAVLGVLGFLHEAFLREVDPPAREDCIYIPEECAFT